MSEVTATSIAFQPLIAELVQALEKRINWLKIDIEDKRKIIERAEAEHNKHNEELKKCLQELEKYKQALQDTACMFVTTLS